MIYLEQYEGVVYTIELWEGDEFCQVIVWFERAYTICTAHNLDGSRANVLKLIERYHV